MKTTVMLILLLAPLLSPLPCATAYAGESSMRWEADIQDFERRDQSNPPPPHAVLFLGSSSIRLWTNLAQAFPHCPVINRGFGGSQIEDSVRYFDRIVRPYRPRLIVMYAGGNDLNAGKTPDTVFRDFQAFAARVKASLPGTSLAFVSISPSPARWEQVGKMKQVHALIKAYARRQRGVHFVDVFPCMLGRRASARPELFVVDRLHLNARGYELWRQTIGAQLVGLRPPQTIRPLKGGARLSPTRTSFP